MVRAHSLYPDHCTLTTACCCGACIAPSYVCKLPKDEPYCAGHYVCPKGRRAGMHMMGSSGAYRQHTGPYAGGAQHIPQHIPQGFGSTPQLFTELTLVACGPRSLMQAPQAARGARGLRPAFPEAGRRSVRSILP